MTSSNINKCNNLSPVVAAGLIVGSSLTTATILSPKIRKVTLPLAKFALKQHVRALVGLSLLSIATSIASCPDEPADYL